MIVTHTIEDENHVVRIYEPGGKREYKVGNWPVTPKDTSLDAIWSGFYQALDAVDMFGAKGIALHSTDAEAFAAYNAEIDAGERHE